ncbi:UvrD-helicase domain-containing protein [Promicromonospora sp. NPDC090134]|uniref:UvrD-helicase domain-containing protein n=1 Tax=Promicromonospora sp. NPDC090134 TaxID=3364408 RepID=UPI0038237318
MTLTNALDEISSSVSLKAPQSFFLYAGAGAGKTAQLVSVLGDAANRCGPALRARGSQFCVITYTNAAAEEIQVRLGRDPLVQVSTIHSFSWELIRPFTKDIATWLRTRLQRDLADLADAEASGRSGTRVSERRLHNIERKTLRLETLAEVRQFRYSPLQTSPTAHGLAHAEVLQAAAHLLSEKPVLQELLIGRFPFLFIDEVQDTNKVFMDAILAVQIAHSTRFCVGLFGDTMQRIYADGKERLEEAIGPEWKRPALEVNFRSTQRIVQLVNSIRADGDGRTQTAHSANTGVVRLFIADEESEDRAEFETQARTHMALSADDSDWSSATSVKTLILEHSLAAARHGFAEFLQAFKDNTRLRQEIFGRDQGGSAIVNFLGTQFLPLVRAIAGRDNLKTERILRSHSPLLAAETDARNPETRARLVAAVRRAVTAVRDAAVFDGEPLLSPLTAVHRSKLLALPDVLAYIIDHSGPTSSGVEDEIDRDSALESWRLAVGVDLRQFERFYEYILGRAPFDTHQGVKGLEFPRVMVVLDDKAAGGFLFRYGKLFGTTPESKTDQENAAAGRETASERTLRLFYVVCSRARDSLAVVLYTSDPQAARTAAIRRGWFTEDEIVLESGGVSGMP